MRSHQVAQRVAQRQENDKKRAEPVDEQRGLLYIRKEVDKGQNTRAHDNADIIAVSYTHLDVYKRQIFA